MTRAIPHEGWLHLDLSAGARADAVAASLLDLGLHIGVVREALEHTGLGRVDVDTTPAHRGRIGGRVLVCSANGSELPGPGQTLLSVSPRLIERHIRARRSRAHRHGPHAESAPKSPESVAAQAQAPGANDDEAGGRGPSLVSSGRQKRAPRLLAPVDSWLEGASAPTASLLEALRESDLEPVAKALAIKAARRLFDALATTRREPTLTTTVPGRIGVRLLAEIVAVAALIEALSPAGITAMPVAVSTALVDDEGLSDARMPGPSPWVLAVLEGVPTVELTLPDACTTPVGGAVAWALAHRYGPRGFSVVERTGTGLFPLDVPGRAAISRALWSAPAPQPTRMGDEPLPGIPSIVQLSALLGPLADASAVTTELRRLGATSIATWPCSSPKGEALLRFEATAPEAQADAAARVLWSAGAAAEVTVARCERHAPGVREVTVPVGRGTKVAVRVVVHTDRGMVLRAEPSADDLREAARQTGATIEALRTEALEAWTRLAGGAEG